MKKKEEGITNRRQYRKPQLEQVSLVVEEAVLTTCKTVISGAGDQTGCKVSNCGKTPFAS